MRQPLVAINDQGRRIGEGHPLARLSDAEVELIHELREEGMSYSQLAARFGVSKSCIAHILTGRRAPSRPRRPSRARGPRSQRVCSPVSRPLSRRGLCCCRRSSTPSGVDQVAAAWVPPALAIGLSCTTRAGRWPSCPQPPGWPAGPARQKKTPPEGGVQDTATAAVGTGRLTAHVVRAARWSVSPAAMDRVAVESASGC